MRPEASGRLPTCPPNSWYPDDSKEGNDLSMSFLKKVAVLRRYPTTCVRNAKASSAMPADSVKATNWQDPSAAVSTRSSCNLSKRFWMTRPLLNILVLPRLPVQYYSSILSVPLQHTGTTRTTIS